MAFNDPVLNPTLGAPRPGLKLLVGQFAVGAAGAVSSQDGALKAGFTIAKNAAAGRYDVTLYRPHAAIVGGFCSMVGPASAAFPTTTGTDPQLRPSNGPTGATSNIQVQFLRVDTMADADAASGTVCYVFLMVSDLSSF